MQDILRKGILFGLGAAYLTKDKVEEFYNDLVTNQNITPEEGKKLVNETLDKVNEFRIKQQGEIKQAVASVLQEMGVATKKDIADLGAKIDGKQAA